MKISTPQLLFDARAGLGEGPAWDSIRNRLYWVDIHAGRIHTWHPETGADEFVDVGVPVGCLAPTVSGSLILGLRDGIATLDLPSAKLSYLTHPESHLPGNRFNDGKCGPDGRFLAGTMDNAEKLASGSLYSLSLDGTLKTLLSGVRISNGLAWSRNHKILYYIDTPTRAVMAYDYDLTSGAIANPRQVVTIPPALGWPDGMTSDTAGRLWIGMWGGAAITIWDAASGQLVEKIPFPAKNVTACVFSGLYGTQLFVTSARRGLDSADLTEYPASGGLFRVETDVEGMPTFVFGNSH